MNETPNRVGVERSDVVLAVIRRWLFSVIDDLDSEHYLDENGEAVDYSEAKEWIGNDREAMVECERRADLYQEQSGWILKAKYHSQGKANGA